MIYKGIRISFIQLRSPKPVEFGNIKQSSKWLLLFVALVQGCGSVPPRNALPPELANEATIPGIEYARFWGGEAPPFEDEWLTATDAEIQERYPAIYGKEHHYLAISGGSAKGAFGAGLLVGWSSAGTRPEFTIVTGISAGAMIAPFAFLGSEYDAQLKEVLTQHSTKDFFKKRSILKGLNSDAMADSSPLRALIQKYIDDDMVQAIAAEYRKGRELYIGTTNLDAQRPVIWDIGRIALSDLPNAKELIQDIMLASASLPVAFPPVMIDVEADGQRYDEMHVDGGAASQVFLYPLAIDWREIEEILAVKGIPQAYLIRNSYLDPDLEPIERSTRQIASSTIDSLIRSQGIGDMYRIYTGTKRDGLDFNLAYIPNDFDIEPKEVFDPVYMNALFELGYDMAKEGYPWKKVPPGMIEQ